MNKKTFTWLAIGAIIIAIAIKNRKDEEEEEGTETGTRVWTGGRLVPETPKWEDTKPAQPKVAHSELVNTTEKNRRVGDGLIV